MVRLGDPVTDRQRAGSRLEAEGRLEPTADVVHVIKRRIRFCHWYSCTV